MLIFAHNVKHTVNSIAYMNVFRTYLYINMRVSFATGFSTEINEHKTLNSSP